MVIGTHTQDFKEQNMDLMVSIGDFAEIYRNNTPGVSSKILWSAYLVAVVSNPNNPYKNAKSDNHRREMIKDEYFPEYGQKYLPLEKLFRSLCLSKAETLYNIHLRKYEELTVKMAEFNLDDDDEYKKYMDTAIKLEKLIKVYDALEKRYNTEKKSGGSKEGGGSFSVAERRNMKKR